MVRFKEESLFWVEEHACAQPLFNQHCFGHCPLFLKRSRTCLWMPWYSLWCCEVKIVPRIQIRLQRLRGDPAYGVLTRWMLTAWREGLWWVISKDGLVAPIPHMCLKVSSFNSMECARKGCLASPSVGQKEVSCLLLWKPWTLLGFSWNHWSPPLSVNPRPTCPQLSPFNLYRKI